jgi:hypothetical protein
MRRSDTHPPLGHRRSGFVSVQEAGGNILRSNRRSRLHLSIEHRHSSFQWQSLCIGRQQ